MNKKRNRLSGCCLSQILKARKETAKARQRVRELERECTTHFVEAAKWQRRCKLRAIEGDAHLGMVEYLTWHVCRAQSMDELKAAVDGYKTWREEREADLARRSAEIRDFILSVNGKKVNCSVF